MPPGSTISSAPAGAHADGHLDPVPGEQHRLLGDQRDPARAVYAGREKARRWLERTSVRVAVLIVTRVLMVMRVGGHRAGVDGHQPARPELCEPRR